MIRPVMSNVAGLLLKYFNTNLTIDGVKRNKAIIITTPKICLCNGMSKYIALYALSKVSVVAMNTNEDKKELFKSPFLLSNRKTPIESSARNAVFIIPNPKLLKMGNIIRAFTAIKTIDNARLDFI